MKKDLYYLSVIVVGFFVLFFTSLLLEWSFVQDRVVRQVLVYVIMLLEAFIIYKNLFNGNSGARK